MLGQRFGTASLPAQTQPAGGRLRAFPQEGLSGVFHEVHFFETIVDRSICIYKVMKGFICGFPIIYIGPQ